MRAAREDTGGRQAVGRLPRGGPASGLLLQRALGWGVQGQVLLIRGRKES